MKVSIGTGGSASGRQGSVRSRVEYVVEAEKPGLGTVRVAQVRNPAGATAAERLETLGRAMGLL